MAFLSRTFPGQLLAYEILVLISSNIPQVSRVDLGYDETGVVPGRSWESSEQAQHDYHKYLRVDNVEKKHRGGGRQEAESWREGGREGERERERS